MKTPPCSPTLRPLIAALRLLPVLTWAAGCTPVEPANLNPAASAPEGGRLSVLFLGDGGSHRPAERLRDLAPALLDRGIGLVYSEDRAELSVDRLRRYDAVLLYGDHQGLAAAEADELIAYVSGGGGLVAIHSAADAFQTSRGFEELLGARGRPVAEGLIATRVGAPEHEIMSGLTALESRDEHFHLDPPARTDRNILEFHGDQPWSWVRAHGSGRVFYTAWGHGESTWRDPAFHDLLERAILWAGGQDVARALARPARQDPYRYSILDVPFPPPHRVRLEYESSVGPMDRRANNPRFHDMQLPLDPAAAIQRMIVPPGFRVELFASEPDIVNPIAMNWDERGRLWVVESVEYPYPRELWADGGGKDRILILEDTTGDGRADTFKVFAEDLNIPTGITFANGGVIVAQAPQTLFLKDTDGDDRADVRTLLFEGWSQSDTHAGPSNLHYGLDNWIWGVVGYAGFEGTVGGESHAFRQGVYRFRSDGSELELLQRTSNNTWGLGFDEQGGAFVSTANGNPSTYMPFPRRYSARVQSLPDPVTESLVADPRILPISNEFRQVDWVGAYTSAAGHAIYTARAYPSEYWNRVAFVTEPTGHLVGEFLLRERGAGYVADHPRNLIVSDDQWFSPVAAEVGPDGQVWIADWYNYVLQHNAESDRQRPSPGNAYANPLRDRQHGRIYRIVYEGSEPTEPMTLSGATPGRLVATLGHENLLWRKHAQRLLVERGATDVVPALLQLLEDQTPAGSGADVGAIHALWTLHGLGQFEGGNAQALDAARAALRHPWFGVRRTSVQVLPADAATAESIVALLEDEHPQVRLQTLLALSEAAPDASAGRHILEMAKREGNLSDPWIRVAATVAAVHHAEGFLAAAAAAGITETPGSDTGPAPVNLLPHATFEADAEGRPVGWTASAATGTSKLALAPGEGRNGGNALTIGSLLGADASWVSRPISLDPQTRYQLGVWIRTEDIVRGGGRGAQIDLSSLPIASRTNPVDRTSEWTFQSRTFVPPEPTSGSIRLSLGAGGNSSGQVWFDGVVLHALGPEEGATVESFVARVAHAVQESRPQ